jgi:heat shock protein HtpX
MRSYGLRATLFSVALCAALLAAASLWLGLVGAAAVSALLVALGWIIYFHSERKVLTALRAHPVSEVERPDLYRIVRELAFSAHLPVPRLFVSPAAQPNILTVGYSPRSAAVCCTEGLLRLLSLGELRAVLAHELAHVGRRDFAVSSWSAGLGSLVASCPLIVVMLHITAPSGREYGADIDGALLTGDPLALISALRKIDTAALAQPLRPRGTLAAASHLMIAHPFPSHGLGGMLSSHPPTSERVRRLEALSGGPQLLPRAPRGLVGLGAGSAVVDELHGEVEVLAFEQADDRLQVVAALRGNAQFLTLDLCLDALRPLVPDDLGDLLGVLLGDALLEGNRDAVLLAGHLRIRRVQVLE